MRWLKAQDMVVGVTQKWERERPEYFPELSKKPIVGSFFEPNYEAIIDQRSDIVFTWSSWTSPGAEEMQKKLDPAGVTVVGLDLYRPSTFTNEVKMMGMILGKEDEADQFIDFYQSQMDKIKDRVGEIPQEQRKTVYYEYMNPYNTFGSNNELVEVFDIVGIKGAFNDSVERFDVSAEDVVVANPDVIIKEPYIFGYTLTNTSSLEKARDELVDRPELAEVKAVKDGKVYALTFEINQASSIPVILPTYLAKLLYPEEFKDLDLEAYMKEYLEEYQGIPYQGIYIFPPL